MEPIFGSSAGSCSDADCNSDQHRRQDSAENNNRMTAPRGNLLGDETLSVDSNDSQFSVDLVQRLNDLDLEGGSTPPNSREPTRGPPKSRGWQVVRKHLNEGTLLLGLNDCPSRTRGSVRQSIANRIQEGSNISIQFCLLSIGLYLVVSVAMYTFVLEPNWTIIDSCYFAVTTFTTLGYGDLSVSHRLYEIGHLCPSSFSLGTSFV